MKGNNFFKSVNIESVKLTDNVILKSTDGSIEFGVENNEIDLSFNDVKKNPIYQEEHGLIAGDFIYIYERPPSPTGGGEISIVYGKASATSDLRAEVIGVVTDVIDSDNFSYRLLSGVYEGAGIPTAEAGSAVFLSDEFGEISDSPGSVIRKPVGVILESGVKMVLFSMLGTSTYTNSNPQYENYDYVVSPDNYNELRFIVENTSYKKIFVPNGTYKMTSSRDYFLEVDREVIIQGESRDGVIFDIDFSDFSTTIYGIKAVSEEGKLSTISDISFNFGETGQIGNHSQITLIEGINKLERVNFTNAYSTFVDADTLCVDDCMNVNDILMTNVESGIKGSQHVSNIIANCEKNGLKEFIGMESCENLINISITGFNNGYKDCHDINKSYAILCEVGFFQCENMINVEATGDSTSIGFQQCTRIINGSAIDQLDGYYTCFELDNCVVDADNILSRGFYTCRVIRNCINKSGNIMKSVFEKCSRIYSCHAVAGNKGFSQCDDLTFCNVEDVSLIGFEGSDVLIGCYSSDTPIGYSLCNKVSNSRGYNSSTNTFIDCDNLINCSAIGTVNKGFENCTFVGGCYSLNAITNGYLNCTQISNSESVGTAYGFESCSYISNCKGGNISTNKVGIPFKDCNHISNCNASNCETGFNDCDFIQGGSVSDTSGTGILNCEFITGIKLTGINGAYSFSDCSRLTGCYSEGPALIDPTYGGAGSCQYLVNCEILGVDAIDGALKLMCLEYTP